MPPQYKSHTDYASIDSKKEEINHNEEYSHLSDVTADFHNSFISHK